MIHFITINNSPSSPSSNPTFRTSKLSQVVIFPSFVHSIYGINGRIHENLRHLRHPETSAWYGIYYIYSWAWNKLLVQPQVDILIEIVIDLFLRFGFVWKRRVPWIPWHLSAFSPFQLQLSRRNPAFWPNVSSTFFRIPLMCPDANSFPYHSKSKIGGNWLSKPLPNLKPFKPHWNPTWMCGHGSYPWCIIHI